VKKLHFLTKEVKLRDMFPMPEEIEDMEELDMEEITVPIIDYEENIDEK
jgi:hypothetical protein